MTDFSQSLETWFNAVTFAEAGEFDTARDLLKGEQHVLLVLPDDQFQQNTLDHALNLSSRCGATILDIFYPPLAEAHLQSLLQTYHNSAIRWQTLAIQGDLGKAVLEYTRHTPTIAFVMLEEVLENLAVLTPPWRHLPCPLVVMMPSSASS
jgi:hypothetical protein